MLIGPADVQSHTGQVKQTDKSLLSSKKKRKPVDLEWKTGKEQQATGTDGYRLRHSATWADARQPRPRFFQPVGNSQMAAFRGAVGEGGWVVAMVTSQPTSFSRLLLGRFLLLFRFIYFVIFLKKWTSFGVC